MKWIDPTKEYIMSEDHLNRREQIHINCPYCWAEFQNFEQIGGRIRYKNKIYDSFEILPIMIDVHHSFIKYIKKFSDNFVRVNVKCPECGRHYRLVLFPYDRKKYSGLGENVKFNENEIVETKDYSLLHKLGLVSDKEGIIRTLFDHYKRLSLYFVFSFIVVLLGSWFYNEQLSSELPFLIIIFLLLGVYLSLFRWHSNHSRNLKTIATLPFLIHDNYNKTYSNTVFQKKLINRLGFSKNSDRWILLLVNVAILWIILLGLRNVLIDLIMPENILYNSGIFIFIVLFLISIFIFYTIVLYVGMSVVDILHRLMYIFRNVPIRLDPWDKHYGIKKITDIWSSTVVTYVVVTIIIPVLLSYQRVLIFFNYLITSPDKLSVIIQLFSNSSFLYLVIGNLFFIILFLYMLYLMQTNIDDRKDELKKEIKEKIEIISNKNEVSNQELSKVSLFKLEYEQIEKIPLIPIPYGFILTMIYAIFNIIIIIIGIII